MDRWILPTRQTDIPGRDLVAHDALHGRRESTFLALVSLYLVAMIALPLFAAGQMVVDLGEVLNAQLSLGVLMFPVAICAAQLVCELYSSRRAGALVIAGAFVSFAIIGVQLIANGGDAIVSAVALVACSTIAQAANMLVFSAARIGTRGRNLGLRVVLSAGLAQLLGWSAFIIVLGTADLLTDEAVALAMAACVYGALVAVATALPLAFTRRWLATYLRVGRFDDELVDHSATLRVAARSGEAGPFDHDAEQAPPPRRRRLPPATIIDDQPAFLRAQPGTVVERPFRPELHPFTTGEMEFFAEGEALEHDYS